MEQCVRRPRPRASRTDVQLRGSTRFRVEGIPQGQDAAFREAAADVETRFNASPARAAPTAS